MQQPENQLDDLVKILSHQLKSPINSIESLLNVIAAGYTGDQDTKTRFFIEKALVKTKEARALISDIIKFESYTESRPADKNSLNLVAVLQNLVKSLLSQAMEKNILLKDNLPENKRIFLNGNQTALEQAFRNLLENAVKYTDQQGKIEVNLEEDLERKQVTVTVTDTGAGIEQQDLEKIFLPFFRAARMKNRISGTGLGLAIVKRVIEGHSGTIAVESQPGKGTSFKVTLPYTEIELSREKTVSGRRIVIIGGVTAGPKAAARLRRLDETLDITIIEKSEFLSYSGCGLPAYISGKVSSPQSLMTTADNTLRDVHFFESIKNINIMYKTEALSINRSKKTVLVRELKHDNTREIGYDVLVIATGASSLVPEISGINQPGIYSLYSIEDAENIKKELRNHPARDIIIIGGGLIGVETAESLMTQGARVTILEKDRCILKFFDCEIALKIQNLLNKKGIKILTRINVTGISKEMDKLKILTDQGNFASDLIVLSAGVRPNASLGREAGLEIGKSGGIKVNEFLQTSDPQIYAIGDCAEGRNLISKQRTYLPLGSISTKMGRIAADNICGNSKEYPGNLGTVMFKSFDLNVARTGLGTEEAGQNGFQGESIIVSGLDRSHYYGNAENIFIKVIADKKTLRILGAQGYGRGDIVRRITLIACAITGSMTLDDLFDVDLGYYPAFNNPIDIIQYACLLLKSKITGFCRTVTPQEYKDLHEKCHTIDVSPAYEYDFDSIPDSINIPLENLRSEKIPFAKNSKLVLCSKTSSRAYQACRYLCAQGYREVFILEGGMLFWKN